MIYLDHAATYGSIPIPMLETIMPYLTGNCPNASTTYSIGRQAQTEIKNATQTLKKLTGAKEIYYTSGATEANNWVINNYREGVIISSGIEHHSILNVLDYYEKWYDTEYYFLNVDRQGNINLDELEDELASGTDLCTIMCVNNETGIIQNINAIYDLCHKYNCAFHTDLTQAYGHMDITKLKYDYASISAHKFGGMQGVGALLCNAPIKPFIIGGSQQNNMRGGTYNLCGIISMAKAADINKYSPERDNRCREIQQKFYSEFSKMQDIYFNTDINNCISSTLNISFKSIESESLMLLLDNEGICVGSGSACTSGSLEPSHVLKAKDTPEEYLYGAIRLSWDDRLTDEEVEIVIESIKRNVKKVRGY